jgi:transcriptional regulator with XRE-family HTH domain
MARSLQASFPARLRELREEAAMTQIQLANLAGVHLSAITRYEQGIREPTLAIAAALASALGVRVDDFLSPPGQELEPRPKGRPRKPVVPSRLPGAETIVKKPKKK